MRAIIALWSVMLIIAGLMLQPVGVINGATLLWVIGIVLLIVLVSIEKR